MEPLGHWVLVPELSPRYADDKPVPVPSAALHGRGMGTADMGRNSSPLISLIGPTSLLGTFKFLLPSIIIQCF